MKTIARNKKAYFDYRILEELEAGLVLLGPEIKAIRSRQVQISGSYLKPFTTAKGQLELWWLGGHFNLDGQDQTRTKKILLHAREIYRLVGRLNSKNLALLPLELYLSRGRAKLKIGLGQHKRKSDKREILRRRDLERDIEREIRAR